LIFNYRDILPEKRNFDKKLIVILLPILKNREAAHAVYRLKSVQNLTCHCERSE